MARTKQVPGKLRSKDGASSMPKAAKTKAKLHDREISGLLSKAASISSPPRRAVTSLNTQASSPLEVQKAFDQNNMPESPGPIGRVPSRSSSLVVGAAKKIAKRRGRPPGSKNKSPAKKRPVDDSEVQVESGSKTGTAGSSAGVIRKITSSSAPLSKLLPIKKRKLSDGSRPSTAGSTRPAGPGPSPTRRLSLPSVPMKSREDRIQKQSTPETKSGDLINMASLPSIPLKNRVNRTSAAPSATSANGTPLPNLQTLPSVPLKSRYTKAAGKTSTTSHSAQVEPVGSALAPNPSPTYSDGNRPSIATKSVDSGRPLFTRPHHKQNRPQQGIAIRPGHTPSPRPESSASNSSFTRVWPSGPESIPGGQSSIDPFAPIERQNPMNFEQNQYQAGPSAGYGYSNSQAIPSQTEAVDMTTVAISKLLEQLLGDVRRRDMMFGIGEVGFQKEGSFVTKLGQTFRPDDFIVFDKDLRPKPDKEVPILPDEVQDKKISRDSSWWGINDADDVVQREGNVEQIQAGEWGQAQGLTTVIVRNVPASHDTYVLRNYFAVGDEIPYIRYPIQNIEIVGRFQVITMHLGYPTPRGAHMAVDMFGFKKYPFDPNFGLPLILTLASEQQGDREVATILPPPPDQVDSSKETRKSKHGHFGHQNSRYLHSRGKGRRSKRSRSRSAERSRDRKLPRRNASPRRSRSRSN